MMLLLKPRQITAMVSIAIVVFALLLTAGWWFLDSERTAALSRAASLTIERDHLGRMATSKDERLESMSRQVAVLQRSAQVKSTAYSKIDEQLRELQREILELKEEVAFYRGIVSENNGSSRVRIQNFALESEGSQRDYRFRVVLTRGKRSDKVAAGTISLNIDGQQGGKAVRLKVNELSTFAAPELTFKFKHFQRITGRFVLPEEFTPKQVVVEIRTSGAGSRPARETFSWSVENSRG